MGGPWCPLALPRGTIIAGAMQTVLFEIGGPLGCGHWGLVFVDPRVPSMGVTLPGANGAGGPPLFDLMDTRNSEVGGVPTVHVFLFGLATMVSWICHCMR